MAPPLHAGRLGLIAAALWLATGTGIVAATARELKLGLLTTWKGGVWTLPQALLGILPALESIASDPALLPGYNLSFIWADTQCSTRYAAEAAGALLNSGIDVLIGSPCSGDSLLIAPQTTLYGVPMISYYAVHSGLSNKVTYPSFVRVVVSMKTYDLGMITLMRHFGWKHAALIYPVSSGFSLGWADSLRQSLAEAAFVVDVEVPYGSFGAAQVEQLKGAGAQIALWLAYSCEWAREVFLTAYDHDILDGWVWMAGAVGTGCWSSGDDRDADALRSFDGVYAVTAYFPVDQSSLDGLDAMKPQFAPFVQAHMGTAAPGPGIEVNPYGYDYSIDQIGSADLTAALMYDAIILWAKAAHAVLASGGSLRDISTMRSALISTTFMGLSGEVELTATGDRNGNSRIDMVSLSAAGDGLDKELIAVYWGLAHELEIYIGDSEFIWAGGQRSLPRDHRVMCEAGEFLPRGSDTCMQCPLGRAAAPRTFDRPECEECEPGRFAGQTGQQACFPCTATGATSGAGASACSLCTAGYAKDGDSCVPCAPGLFANTSLQAECRECPAGRYFEEVGATECLRCPEGHFAGADGQTACDKCPIGTRSSSVGASACIKCEMKLPGSTTNYRGAIETSECVCPQLYFLSRPAAGAAGSCKPCLEGLLCPGGNGAPLQAAGFQAGEPAFMGADPPSRLVCRSSTVCPGGTELGSCPSHRSGDACDLCDLGYFEDGKQCIPCDGNFGAGPLVAVLVVAIFVIVGLVYYHMVRPAKVYSDSNKTVLLTLALSINAVQSITALGSITVEWVEPVKSITNVMKIFSLDVNLLNPGCTFGFNEPWKAYLGTVLGYPFLAASLLAICSVVKALRLAQPVSMRAQIINLQGSVLLVLYLPIAMIAFEPFRCGWNPDGSSTVLSQRSIVCWDDADHATMVALAILAVLLYLVPFLALCLRATLRFRQMIISAAGGDFLRQHAFLFDRFTSDTYWWGMVYLSRSLSIGIMQAHLVNYPICQILLLSLIFVMNIIGVCLLWPWRTRLANYLDITFSGVLQIIIIGAAVLVESTDGTQNLLQYVFFIALIAALVLALVILGRNIYPAIAAPKQYVMFLSHHKLGAQALARWMKIVVSERLPSSQKVFLDSDELRRIDLIFEIVSKKIENLVVLLTKETLSRFWCAIEIASAVEHDVKIVPIACSDYVPPSDKFVTNLEGLWTKSQISDLASLGFTLPKVAAAYSSFRALEASPLDRTAGLNSLLGAVDHVIQACAPSGSALSAVVKRASFDPTGSQSVGAEGSAQAPAVAITCSALDPEMLCTADVLRRLLQPTLQVKVDILLQDREQRWHQLAGAKYLLVVLSNDILESTLFAATAMLVNMSSNISAVPVMTEAPFAFPHEAFWCRVRRGEVLTLSGFDPDQLQQAYRDLFGVISLSFSVAANQRMIRAEVEEMKDRLPDAKRSSDSHPSLGPSASDFVSMVDKGARKPASADVDDVRSSYSV